MLDFIPSGWQNLFLEMCEEIRQKLTGTDEFHRTRFFEIKENVCMTRASAKLGNDIRATVLSNPLKSGQRFCYIFFNKTIIAKVTSLSTSKKINRKEYDNFIAEPCTEIQPDEDGVDRTVWMFPVRPVPDNDVRKPAPFVFRDMEEYQRNGKMAEATWAATHNAAKQKSGGGFRRYRRCSL